MADSRRKDRLSPPLMYAFRAAHAARDATKKIDLRDEAGERVIAGRRSVARSPISESMLRREVARDLDSLVNTIAFESAEDLRGFDAVRKSILNYGLPDLTHRSIDEHSVDDIRNEIRTALMHYEPRLLRESIKASRDMTVGVEELKVRFVVQAELHCEPVNVTVEFVADIELDTGSIQIHRL
jgi:type VI secretion system protein ImpF